MILKPKERLLIYRQALEYTNVKILNYSGLCLLIRESISKVKPKMKQYEAGLVAYSKNLENFPELYKRKPKVTYDNIHWFGLGDMVPRRKILRAAINELKKKGY